MIAKVPVWAFAILFALLVLGQRQSRTRRVAPGSVAILASAMFCLSLYGVVAAFGAQPAAPAALAAWALGIAGTVAFGTRLLGPHGLAREGDAVRIPGSWWPMGLMMGIFAAKFALGFASAVGAPVVTQAWFTVAASLVFGLLSGGFVARALVVHRFARQSEPVPAGRLDLASLSR